MSHPAGLCDEALAALEHPDAYPDDPSAAEGVEPIQTHISYIFRTRDRVYKLRKPVDLGFLCFATLAERNSDCLREVALNRRLAPDVYLGVAPVRRNALGHWQLAAPAEALSTGADGEALEHCVVMRHLPDGANAKRMLENGTLGPAHMRGLAQRVARFHAEHGLGRPAPWNTTQWVERTLAPVRDSFALARESPSETLDAALLDRCEAAMLEFARSRADSLEARRAHGRAVDGHGDLHLDHVWFEHGPEEPIAIDCIEFNEELRRIDVAAELAFTVMDLAYRGRPDLAERLLDAYAEATDDYRLFDVVDFHIAHRALVRASVAGVASREDELDLEQRSAAAASAAEHLEFTAAGLFSERVGALVVVCGIVGTGKSTVARAAGEELSGVVIASDRVRKRLAGLAPTARAGAAPGEGIYDEASTRRVYEALLERARPVVESGRIAILDATHSRRDQRDATRHWAEARGLPMLLLEARCDANETRRRLALREEDPSRVSDAGVAFHAESVRRFEPTDEWPGALRAVIHTDAADWRECLARALRVLRNP